MNKVIFLTTVAALIFSMTFTSCASFNRKASGTEHRDGYKREFLYEEVKNYTLNNKNHKIAYKYYLRTSPDDSVKKWTALAVYFDDKEIYEVISVHIGFSAADPNWEYFSEDINFNKNATKKEIIELLKRKNPYEIKDNITIITNDGVDYFILNIIDSSDNMSALSSSFFNDKGEVLHLEWNNFCVFSVFRDSITDPNYINGNEKKPFYIKDNKYYNVEMDCGDGYAGSYEPGEGTPYTCKIYEKTLTIKQNKVNQEKKQIKTITLDYDYCP
ncbi:MAG: hypothetical protein FWG13_00030 [Leptospirales bacterium]|nr:hypothetical protein [Leptospirales bacterium]